MSELVHDANGPFVRSAHAVPDGGQTETVYAVEVKYGQKTEWWDVSAKPFTDKRLRETRDLAYRVHRGKCSVRLVSRTVTISASEWQEVDQ